MSSGIVQFPTDSLMVRFVSSNAAAVAYTDAILDLADATPQELKCLDAPSANAGAGAGLHDGYYFPLGDWTLAFVHITGSAVLVEAVHIYVQKNATAYATPETGTAVIDNVVTAGAAAVSYINVPLSAVPFSIIYRDSQAGAGAYDNGTPPARHTGFVEAQRTFTTNDLVQVAVGSVGAGGSITGTVADPAQITLVFGRAGTGIPV